MLSSAATQGHQCHPWANDLPVLLVQVVTDLLNPSATKLQIREGDKVYVEGLSQHAVGSGALGASRRPLCV